MLSIYTKYNSLLDLLIIAIIDCDGMKFPTARKFPDGQGA
jgi:hypothetical protein